MRDEFTLGGAMAKRAGMRLTDIHQLVDALFGDDLHAKRVASLASRLTAIDEEATVSRLAA